MEDYILNLTRKACWDDQIFDDWKFAIKCKMRKELNEDNIGCLRFFELKFPAIIYNDSLSYKESPSQDSILKLDNKSELSLPTTDYCMDMFENKIFKKRFAKKENFDILKIDTNLFSYELPKFENTKINNESYEFGNNFSDIVLCNVSSPNHDLDFDKLKTSFISNHGMNYYLVNNEIMIRNKTDIPITLYLNLFIPYGIPFDPKLVYKEKCCGSQGTFPI